MRGRRALLVGATGLVGRYALERLLVDEAFSQVVVLTRRPLQREHPKLLEQRIDFERLKDYRSLMAADTALCCLGTTLKAAGSKAAFERVDYDYVKEFAALAADAGIPQFLLISAVGANPDSVFFYNRVKGRVEQAVRALPFKSIHILRPSLLLGPRGEHRVGEDFTKPLAKAVSFLLWGPLKRYRPVHAETVAAMMVALARQDAPGVQIHYPSAEPQE